MLLLLVGLICMPAICLDEENWEDGVAASTLPTSEEIRLELVRTPISKEFVVVEILRRSISGIPVNRRYNTLSYKYLGRLSNKYDEPGVE